MIRLLGQIKGDRTIWILAVALALFSFLPVYSSSSNLAYITSDGSTAAMLGKHAMHILLGFVLMFAAHNINHKYYAGLSLLLLPVAVLLLTYTLLQGQTIGDANASRWIRIPILGWSFQTSSFASLVLLIYVARYLAKVKGEKISFRQTVVPLLLPVALVCGLILPANFSTAAIIFFLCLILMFVGGYPFRYIAGIIGIGACSLGLFILLVIAFPGISNRVDTWKNRIESFYQGDSEGNYQVEKAKMAIAEGGIIGKGPGKSIQKNFLPQSSSDFIYAIIIEEYGLVGGALIIFLYVILFIRILIVATKSERIFGSLLAVAAGFGIVFQAFINMAVAVNLFPVTGQTLPLISAGGSSIWMTCIGIGIVISVSRSYMETETEENTENPEQQTAHAEQFATA